MGISLSNGEQMYNWPLDEIAAKLDSSAKAVNRSGFYEKLANSAYQDSVADFLWELYENANGGTFWDGAFRVIPFRGSKRNRVPGIVEWNDPTDWKEFAPSESKNVFYFCTNAFGDLLGVPLDKTGGIARDRVGVLWVEKYSYEESSLGWSAVLSKLLKNEDQMATFLARLKEYTWAVEHLGRPDPSQCFSWNLPPILGGSETIDNLKIVPTPIDVSFTLQVISQSRRQGNQHA